MKKEAAPEPGILKTLDNFWFGHGSPSALGLFRIFMAGLTFVNLAMISVDWDAWYGERGFVPAFVGRRAMGSTSVSLWPGLPIQIPRLDLIGGVTDDRLAVAFYILVMLFALLTTVGLWTRFSSICLAIGIVSLHHRNMMILHGGDTVLRVMVLYLALAPCGRACSIDRLIRLWKGTETGEPIRVSLWAQRLIMYNMALIYFTTVWLKWYGSLWKDGTATWYTARIPEFYRFPVPAFANNLPFVKVTTYGTLAVEFALGTLVFYRPARKYVLLAGILMHGWIEYSMNIPLFGFLMVSMYICFYDGEEIQGWAARTGARLRRFATTLHLPVGKKLDPRGVAFFEAVDPFQLVDYQTGDAPEWNRTELRKSWMRSLGAWSFGWIPGLWKKMLDARLWPDEASP